MLHIETIEPGTFSLLKELMENPLLQPFSLVGGTALALRYGLILPLLQMYKRNYEFRI